MKRPALSFVVLLAAGLPQLATAQQTVAPFGVPVPALTLSGGRYAEFFAHDSLQRIGSVVYNTRLRRIVALLPVDSVAGRPSPEVNSRWLSVDPLAHKYAAISPYTFTFNNPIIFNDPDGRDPHIARVKDGKGNTTITVTTTFVLIGQSQEVVAQVNNLNKEASTYFPTRTFDNGDGTTTRVVFENNIVSVATEKEYKKLDKDLSGATLKGRYQPDRKGDDAFYAGDVTFGPKLSARSFFHEIIHDFGFADKYLEDANEFAAVLDGYIGTLQGDSSPFSEQEARVLAAGVNKTAKETGKEQGVYQPVDRDGDEIVVGSSVKVWEQESRGVLKKEPTTTVVQSGNNGGTRKMSK